MNVLLVGSGGREHALAWRLARSPSVDALHAAPGNPGIARLGTCHPVRAEDAEGLLTLARGLDADLVVVGPEAPLVAGVGDTLRRAGLAVFGPSAAAARIEGSKSFAKEVMEAAGVPTAETMAVARAPCVVKADGLTAGKGVHVCRTQDELDAALRAVSARGGGVVIEELLQGKELSLFALVDGKDVLALPEARDYSRVGDGDTGPNTGGMGCYSPVDDAPDPAELVDELIKPVVDELGRRGTPFLGCLYAGLMLTEDGPRVLEFNCRFGDPETQSLLPRLDGDLAAALAAAAAGELTEEVAVADAAAVTVVLAAGGYPEQRDAGSPIAGVDDAEADGALVFHAGTALRDGRLVTNGGRILAVTARGATVAQARQQTYAAVGKISFPGMRYRSDIGAPVHA
ncbi:MAG: phosphoribosylamine--glycine ligase [Thermoleophilia bacterium]|nr:phosphoribosylamine--glycine ligase [Thermoleophilia bacterium]